MRRFRALLRARGERTGVLEISVPGGTVEVTITDDGGKTMGLGNLSAGELQSDGNYGNDCRFTFTVKDVDPSAKYYKVKIGHRDGPTYTLDDLKKGPALTLGD